MTEINKKFLGSAQERFSHYLRSFRQKNNLTQMEMAERLGFVINTYEKLESKFVYSRLAGTIEFLHKYSELEGISIVEFVSLLEFGNSSNNNWGTQVAQAFSSIPASIQFDFIKNLSALDLEKRQKIVELVNLCAGLNEDHLKAIALIAKAIGGNQ